MQTASTLEGATEDEESVSVGGETVIADGTFILKLNGHDRFQKQERETFT